jgi:hypothetical protein
MAGVELMLIRMSEWEQIRAQFSKEEKAVLNLAVTGESICPRGLIIDIGKLTDEVGVKLVNLLWSWQKEQKAGR